MTKIIKILICASVLSLTGCGGSGENTSATINTPPVSEPVDNPESGTILSTQCEGTTQIVELADGQGGSTQEATPKSEQCGYEPIVVNIVRRQADYFKPAIITVESDLEWTYEADAGHVTQTDTGLEILSDGQLGVHGITIEDQEFDYEFVPEPKCEHVMTGNYTKVDCLGYYVGTNSASMIYYGEDDTQVVTIEVGVARTATYCQTDCADGTPIPEDNPQRISAVEGIQKLNKFNEKNGVYIRFELTEMVWLASWYDLYTFGPPRFLTEMSDVVYGWGGSGTVGGQALLPRSIYPGMRTPTPVGRNGPGLGTFAHEIGHAMGLGHGVWGIPNWQYGVEDLLLQSGSFFLEFGHGWNGTSPEGACGSQGSVMSYGSGALWTNSLNSCEELGFRSGNWGDAAGSRLQSDEAYHLNRVRYSYSLIHNEHSNIEYHTEQKNNEENSIFISD